MTAALDAARIRALAMLVEAIRAALPADPRAERPRGAPARGQRARPAFLAQMGRRASPSAPARAPLPPPASAPSP